MQQVLFRIGPVPIYGFGVMLFLAYVACSWLLTVRARRANIAPQHLQDLSLWIFITGLIGARIVFMIQYKVPLQDFYRIWEGGIVFYGSALGGLVGFLLAYPRIIRKNGLNGWQVADIIAPAIVLGLSIGRIGCLLNGCCFGHVACPTCWSLHFPLSAPARYSLVENGLQTAAGFSLDDRDPLGRTIGQVVAGSPVADAGLLPGDVIVGVNGTPVDGLHDLWNLLGADWPRGRTELALTVRRAGQEVALPPCEPLTLGLHPTQLYETISALLIFLLLLAYEPFQRRHGELIAVLMLCYAVHRFINESLRNDTDPVAFGLTLSQNGSIVVFLAGLVVMFFVWQRPPDRVPEASAPVPPLVDAAPIPADAAPTTAPAEA
jgi:phosphatidylglycerol:prolipoprotein diacylglycerol transferase